MQERTQRRALAWIVVLLATVCIAGRPSATSPAVDTAPVTPLQQELAEPPGSSADDEVRATILALVRHHRRTASDAWRRRIADAVFEESVAAGIDPLITASIVARESSFRTQVVSRAGAVGLMQLRPWVAKHVARRNDVPWDGRRTLHEPELNVRIGLRYLQELLERFDGELDVALQAYNRGPTRVRGELRRGKPGSTVYSDRVLVLHEALTDIALRG